MDLRITLLEQEGLGLSEDEEPKRSNCNTCVTKSRDFPEITDIKCKCHHFHSNQGGVEVTELFLCFSSLKTKAKADGLTHGSVAGLLQRSVFFEREWFLPINHLTTHVFKIYTSRARCIYGCYVVPSSCSPTSAN